MEMDQTQLKEMGIKKIGDRVRIGSQAKLFRSKEYKRSSKRQSNRVGSPQHFLLLKTPPHTELVLYLTSSPRCRLPRSTTLPSHRRHRAHPGPPTPAEALGARDQTSACRARLPGPNSTTLLRFSSPSLLRGRALPKSSRTAEASGHNDTDR